MLNCNKARFEFFSKCPESEQISCRLLWNNKEMISYSSVMLTIRTKQRNTLVYMNR
uniref:Uncharacterized protein n=1 Tax=Octopus bimaculoides TaxID=37653 RepID=A0A0L8H734_OCTBM